MWGFHRESHHKKGSEGHGWLDQIWSKGSAVHSSSVAFLAILPPIKDSGLGVEIFLEASQVEMLQSGEYRFMRRNNVVS